MIQNLLLEAEEVHSFFCFVFLLLQIGFGRQLYGININISAYFPSTRGPALNRPAPVYLVIII